MFREGRPPQKRYIFALLATQSDAKTAHKHILSKSQQNKILKSYQSGSQSMSIGVLSGIKSHPGPPKVPSFLCCRVLVNKSAPKGVF